MTEQEILEGNKLIAEFMGWLHSADANIDKHEMANLKYHTSYDWLMPVVEKIEQLGYDTAKYYNSVHKHRFVIHTPNNSRPLIDIIRESAIKSVWHAVTEFIKWYNQNK